MNNLARYHAANLPDLFDKITKNSIGMDDYLNSFFNSDFPQSNYPPYNLVQVNNVESRLEVALAGFSKKEIKVYTEYGKLFVEGQKRRKKLLPNTSIKDWLNEVSHEYGLSPMTQRSGVFPLKTDYLQWNLEK